jgi:putative phosphoesterase
MKIAVISDIHENFHNLILALEDIKKAEAEFIICLGDLMNAGIAKILAIQDVPVYMIWGNNDGEKVDIVNASKVKGSNLTVGNNVYDFLKLDGKKLFITHYDDLSKPMALSGQYDAIFYGHNHLEKIEKINETYVVNPGELCAQKTNKSTYALYDTTKNEVKIIQLNNSISLKSSLVDQYLSKHKDKLNFRSAKSFGIK